MLPFGFEYPLIPLATLSFLLPSVSATPVQSHQIRGVSATPPLPAELPSHKASRDFEHISALEERSLAIRTPKSEFVHPYILPKHFHRHRATTHRIRSLHPELSERSLAFDLTIAGFRLLWQHIDIVTVTALAYYRTTTFYQELIATLPHGEWREGPTVQNILISWGVFKLMLTLHGVNDDLPLAFVEGFANYMIHILQTAVILTYQVVAFSVNTAIWITLAITDGYEPNFITGGPG